MNEAKTNRGERKRQAILAAALDLFAKHGYEDTTMRMIAAAAGVSLGNAYHYFQSKEDLMQAFYEDLCQQQALSVVAAITDHTSFRARLVAAVSACLAVLQPHRQLLSSLLSIAGSPQSRLNPFGKETRHVRERAIKMFSLVVQGSSETAPEDLRADLPMVLWLYYMGILYLWLHDTSFGWQRTNSLINNSAGLLSMVLVLLKLPAPSPVRKPILDVLSDVRGFVG